MAAQEETETKAAFIRKNAHLKPREIMEAAKAAGVDITIQHVYATRSMDKARAEKKAEEKAAKPAKKRKAPTGTVKEFVLSLPKKLTVTEIQDKAKAAGFNVPNRAYVYSIRGSAKKEAAAAKAKTAKAPTKKPGTALAVVPKAPARILKAVEVQGEDGQSMDIILREMLKVGARHVMAHLNNVMSQV